MESIDTSEQQSSTTVEQVINKQNSKGMAIGMIAGIVFGIAGIAFGIYGVFFSGNGKEPSSPEIANDTDITPTPASNDGQETDITNQLIKDDLNRKISILTGVSDAESDDDPVINASLAYSEANNFYSRGFESTAEKAGAVLIGSSMIFTTEDGECLDYCKSNAIRNFIKSNYSEEQLNLVKNGSYSYISYDLANKIYSSMFNESLPKENIKTGICGREYLYIKDADAFLQETSKDGCGGTGWSGIFIRKDSYKTNGNEVYVYAKIATAHLSEEESDWVLYDDYYTPKDANSKGTVINKGAVQIYQGVLSDGKLDSAVFDAAKSYRFVFKKNSSGTFYFSNLEKLSQ